MMNGSNWIHSGLFLCFFFLIVTCSSASTSISDAVFQSSTAPAATSRTLLQAKKSCSVSFEFLNYTSVTSRCKGPDYLPEECCPAFKDFSCPYAELLNDVTNDCASTMFSYLNIYGRYPPGLFANQCKEGKEGLSCPPLSSATSLLPIHQSLLLPLLLLTTALVLLAVH
ncbi:GPI-anchored protein LLG1 [Linum grandiflorum]